jgi:chromatin remodeling complex protein RSC6
MSSAAKPSATTAARKTTKAAAPVAAAAAPVPVAAPAPVPVAAPVVAPVAAPAPATTEAAHTEEVNIVSEFASALTEVNNLRNQATALFSKMKKLEKQIPRELKRAQKGRRARKTVDGVDKPKKETVFTKPTPISDALCTFLGVGKGTLISRSEVTTRVCRYAREKGLMDKQSIKADATLRKLLALKDGDDLKILNLQRFLKPHYIKPAAPVATA